MIRRSGLGQPGACAGVEGQSTILDGIVEDSGGDAVNLAHRCGCKIPAEALHPGLDLSGLQFVQARVPKGRIRVES